jgi:hypothetical protein
LAVAALGFIQDVHPGITFRDSCICNLSEAIHLEMNKAEWLKIKELLPPAKKTPTEEGKVIKADIKLEAIARTVGFGNDDDRIKTEAFQIRIPLEIWLVIKEIMTRLRTQNSLPEGHFITYGLVQSVVQENVPHAKCSVLSNFRTIPVFGLLPQALQHPINIDSPDGAKF